MIVDYPIRRLRPEELDTALELAMDTFLRYEAPDYGPEGVDTFRRDIIDNPEFHESCRNGRNRIWGAFDGELLVGIFGMRGPSHICLVFTREGYHRQGVASAIFRKLLADVRKENPDVSKITLNSSPYGKPFYLHTGFCCADDEKTINGIRFTPLEYYL